MFGGRHLALLVGMTACSGAAVAPPPKPAPPNCVAKKSWTPMGAKGAPAWKETGRVTAHWTGEEALFAVTEFGGKTDASFFDPCRGTWESVSDAGASQNVAALDWIGGRLVAWNVDEKPEARMYDRAPKRWRTIPLPLQARTGPRLGSRVVVYEYDDTNMVAFGVGDVHDLATGTTIPIFGENAPSARVMEASVAVEESGVFVFGGRDRREPAPRRSGAMLDVSTGAWTPLAEKNEPTARYYAHAVAHGQRVVVWGGIALMSDDRVTDGGSYDPVARRWTPIPPAGEAALEHHLVVLTERYLVTAGESSGARFDLKSRSWTHFELPTPMRDAEARANALADGTVLFSHPAGAWLWRYDPRDGRWSSIPLDGVEPKTRTVLVGGDHLMLWGPGGGVMLRL